MKVLERRVRRLNKRRFSLLNSADLLGSGFTPIHNYSILEGYPDRSSGIRISLDSLSYKDRFTKQIFGFRKVRG